MLFPKRSFQLNVLKIEPFNSLENLIHCVETKKVFIDGVIQPDTSETFIFLPNEQRWNYGTVFVTYKNTKKYIL